MKNKSKAVVVTGAESTGKSMLTEKLSTHLGAPLISEFAREYVENLHHPYNFADVENIARMQVQQFNNLKQGGHPLLFADTWLIITKIWFEEVYQTQPDWLEAEIKNADIDLFLVCDIDLPWIPDNVRENGGEKREYLQSRYLDTLNKYGFAYEVVSGFNSIRFQNAVNFLEQHNIIKPNII